MKNISVKTRFQDQVLLAWCSRHYSSLAIRNASCSRKDSKRQHLKLFVPKRLKTDLIYISRIFFVPALPMTFTKLPAGFCILS